MVEVELELWRSRAVGSERVTLQLVDERETVFGQTIS
jgi:hypothetical protein